MHTIKAVGVLVINKKGEILVLLRSKKDPEGNTWGLVGGKINVGENIDNAAIREFKEETGIDVKTQDLIFLKTYKWNRKNVNLIFNLFKLEVSQRFRNLELPHKEIEDFMWVKPEKLYERKDLMQGLYEIIRNNFQFE